MRDLDACLGSEKSGGVIQVVQATWIRHGPRVSDPTMYVGMLGTAFLCFKVHETTGSREDLDLCCQIIDNCASAAETMKQYGFSL